LSNVETGEIRYYYPSQNGFIFDQPLVVANEEDLQRVLQRVGETYWLEYVSQQKPNSKWRIALLTNVAFHLYPLAQVAGRESRSGCTGKRPQHRLFACRPPVLFSMLGATLVLRFEKLGKKDPRIGLDLLGHAGESGQFRWRALEGFAGAG